jgi:hypothetical protein
MPNSNDAWYVVPCQERLTGSQHRKRGEVSAYHIKLGFKHVINDRISHERLGEPWRNQQQTAKSARFVSISLCATLRLGIS